MTTRPFVNIKTGKITEVEMSQPRQLSLFDLETLETRIRAGMAAFMEVGTALAQVQDAKGWKLRNYKSFEEYCEKELNFSVRHGQRLIQAAQVAEKVQQLTGEAPRNEAVAREIGKVAYAPNADKNMKKVQAELKSQGKTIATATAEVIARVVEHVISPKPTPKTTSAPAPAPEPAPLEAMSVPEIPALQDFCPFCGEVPETYVRRPDGWHCWSCDAHVMLGVVLVEAA